MRTADRTQRPGPRGRSRGVRRASRMPSRDRRQTLLFSGVRRAGASAAATGRPRRQTSSAVSSEITRAAPDNAIGNAEFDPLSVVAAVAAVWLSLPAALPAAEVEDCSEAAAAGLMVSVGAGCSGSTDGSAETSFQLTLAPSE